MNSYKSWQLEWFYDVKTGRPQGSILGPILFFVNPMDLSEVTNNTHIEFLN